MQEVYSMVRKGNPLWAVAATAALFLFSTGMAALVVRHKTVTAQIVLRQPQLYSSLGLQARFPEGWEVGSPQKIPNGQVIVAAEPASGSGRQVLLFRVRPSMFGNGQVVREAAVAKAVGVVAPDAQVAVPGIIGTGKVGKLDSQIYKVVARLSPGADLRVGLANVAVGPDRQVVGVMLLEDGPVSARDQRLLDEISQSVSYEENHGKPPKSRSNQPEKNPDDSDEIPGKPVV